MDRASASKPVLMCALVLSVIVLGWKLSATFALGLLLIAGAIALAMDARR